MNEVLRARLIDDNLDSLKYIIAGELCFQM